VRTPDLQYLPQNKSTAANRVRLGGCTGVDCNGSSYVHASMFAR
jgi:hypothetical protein